MTDPGKPFAAEAYRSCGGLRALDLARYRRAVLRNTSRRDERARAARAEHGYGADEIARLEAAGAVKQT